MTHATWRDHAAPIIARVLEENRGKSVREIRKALKAAYPYGERAMHPYRIWCNEVRKQLIKLKVIEAKRIPVTADELPLWLKMKGN